LVYYVADTDVFLISETWLDPKDQITFKGFDIVRKDRIDRRGGGVLIMVCSNLKYNIMENIPDCQGNLEACGIELFLKQGKMSIISVYRPPDGSRINSRMWQNFFANFHGKFFIGGDFNLPSDQIIPLEEGILDLDITLLNDDSPTFWDAERDHWSKLDLSLASSSLGIKTSWLVNQDTWGSDHFPIFIYMNISITPKSKVRRPPKLYSSKTDWAAFSENIEKDINNYISDLLAISDIQSLYTSFTSIIVDNITKATSLKVHPSQGNTNKDSTHLSQCNFHPKRKINYPPYIKLPDPNSPKLPKKKKIPSPWWNEACDVLP